MQMNAIAFFSLDDHLGAADNGESYQEASCSFYLRYKLLTFLPVLGS